MTALPEERLGPLRVAKLRALLGDRVPASAEGAPLGTGAALIESSGRAAVLVEEAHRRSLGGVLTWAVRKGVRDLVVIVDADEPTAGHLARVAGWFALPVHVERVAGTAMEPVAPAPYVARPAPGAVDGSAFEATLRDAGCDVVVEHGVTRGEILGLEVARVVPGEDGPTLEVGVGRFDREISTMMFASIPTDDALAKAIELVRRHRAPGGEIHPLRDLVPERWLRAVALADPAVVGAEALRPIDTTVPPESLREPQPAAAMGEAPAGEPVVVVCTAGVDLDAVALAADTRGVNDPAAELVIAAPQRSLIAPVLATGAALARPARFVALELP